MPGWIRGECAICGNWDYGSWETAPAGLLVRLGKMKYARYNPRQMVRIFACHYCQVKYNLEKE